MFVAACGYVCTENNHSWRAHEENKQARAPSSGENSHTHTHTSRERYRGLEIDDAEKCFIEFKFESRESRKEREMCMFERGETERLD